MLFQFKIVGKHKRLLKKTLFILFSEKKIQLNRLKRVKEREWPQKKKKRNQTKFLAAKFKHNLSSQTVKPRAPNRASLSLMS